MSITTSTLEIAAPDGTMPAFLAEPEGPGPHPVVVVLMEAFGLVEHIENVAKRLAREGYLAVAPDVYYRELPDNKVGYDELPRAIALMQRIDDAKFIGDLKALLGALGGRVNANTSRLGVTGFCMGGRLAFLAACEFGEAVRAAAPFYGGGTVGLLDRAEGIRAPLALFFGAKDFFIPLDQVGAIDQKLEALKKPHAIHLYEDAVHGFFCENRDSYHAEAAADAWTRLLAHFREHLS